MKVIIATQELNYIINKCIGIVPQNPTIPILSNFLIEAKNGEFRLICSDLGVGVSAFTEAKVLEDGKFCVSARKFSSLIREIKSINVEISSDDECVVHILADDSKFKLNGTDYNDYPALPDVAGATTFKVKEDEIKDMFYRTSFAVSRDDERVELTGVYMNIKESVANFMGTDGKRLAMASMKVDLDSEYSGSRIIPLKAVEEIVRCLDDGNENMVTCYLLEDKVAFETERFFIVTKLISSTYPDLSAIIPKKIETSVLLHKEELMILLRQVALFSPEKQYSACFTFDKGELKLNANTMEVGEGRVSMPANWQGAKVDIAFNPIYFLDILKHCKNESVTLSLIDAFNPGVITDTDEAMKDPTDAKPLFILMPMNLSKVAGQS